MEHPHILDIAQQAMRDCDIEPVMKPSVVEPMVHSCRLWACRARTCLPVDITTTASMSS